MPALWIKACPGPFLRNGHPRPQEQGRLGEPRCHDSCPAHWSCRQHPLGSGPTHSRWRPSAAALPHTALCVQPGLAALQVPLTLPHLPLLSSFIPRSQGCHNMVAGSTGEECGVGQSGGRAGSRPWGPWERPEGAGTPSERAFHPPLLLAQGLSLAGSSSFCSPATCNVSLRAPLLPMGMAAPGCAQHLCLLHVWRPFVLQWTVKWIIESLRLEKTSKIIKSNCQPSTTMPAKPYPEVPHLHVFCTPPWWWVHHFPGQPVPILDHSFSK